VLILSRVFDAAKELGVKRVLVTECGHAYDALRWTAANIMKVPPGIEITHIIRVMYDFWKAGRIRLKQGAFDGVPITFHDSCKIQRRGGHIKEPRELLKWLAPKAFREMTPNKEQALCCGGGGGVISIQEADPLRFAVFGMKIDQMKAVGAEAVTMVCSNCRLQFVEGVAHFGSGVKVRGLTEMVALALEQ
jgi:Fe-S oxidoreductase